MNSTNGARIYLIPTLDPRLCAVFVDPLTSLGNTQAGSSGDPTDSVPGFKEYVHKCFANASHVEEELQDKDLWIPNFRVTAISEDTLKHTFSGEEKPIETVPNSVNSVDSSF